MRPRLQVSFKLQDTETKLQSAFDVVERLQAEVPQIHGLIYSSLPGSKAGTEQRVHNSGHSDATSGQALRNGSIRYHYRRAVAKVNAAEQQLKEALEELALAVDAADAPADWRDPEAYYGRNGKPPLLDDGEHDLLRELQQKRHERGEGPPPPPKHEAQARERGRAWGAA